MTVALVPAPINKQTSPARITEKLDVELDFVRASLPARTRLTHPHILFSPLHYEPNYAYPLLVWLHGTGEDERQLTRIMPVISVRNYVAVAPRGLPTEPAIDSPTLDLSVSAILQRPKKQYDWNCSEDHLTIVEQRVFDCIAVAQERCNIAHHRIFIAGFGTGGTAALRLAMLYPECFAGAATFGAEIPSDASIFPSWYATQPLSLMFGIEKPVTDYARKMVELCHTAGFSVDVQEYPDTKYLTSAMLRDLNDWMMRIVCQQRS